ncbi:MAG: DUF177 domain-containing protein [Peptococcaceae bacterium]|nr:DUF177 domain-containing protein [Peptococcaceae bacterium]
MLRMDVSRLKRSAGDSAFYQLTGEIPPIEDGGEKLYFTGPVRASFTVTNTGEMLRVEGTAAGELRLSCSRCLEPFTFPFEVALEENYIYSTGEAPGEAVPFTGDFLDVTPEVQKGIIMALPMKALCREDCPGLCPGCGRRLAEGTCGCAGEDIDPRLAALKKLLE